MFRRSLAAGAAMLLCTLCATAQPPQKITVQLNRPGAAVQPTMWGVFFEDINFAADGGLYAELVKNRSFEFSVPLMGWKEVKQNGTGSILITNRAALNAANPRYARIAVNAPGEAWYGWQNEGFRGMGLQQGRQYNFSVWAAAADGAPLKMKVALVNEKGESIGETPLDVAGTEWKQYRAVLTASATAAKGALQVLLSGNGAVHIDMVSLFPADTWKQRPNGLRADLVQMLAALKPGFVRFPGGCIVEGRDLANRYQWKKTVGKPEERTLIINRWNTEFPHRAAPDYFQSFGLGFFEYFQLAEDIGAEPLPILNCGMACQFNTGEVAEMDQVDTYVQDALDLIEFANGDVDTKWGRLRADMGHPASFHLKMLGVGNEQWDEQYVARYKIFEQALQSKYPDIKLIASAGPFAGGPLFNYLWKELKNSRAGFMDEHYYMPPAWFLSNAARYDNYDRTGPKIFAGEYAAHTREGQASESRNTWGSALAEAAFMTGLERNADIVHMASYAPLFAHVEAWQWRPDLIWFDNLRAAGSPNYYVQQLFSTNRGTRTVPVLRNGAVLAGKDSLYASATIDETSRQLLLKIVNAGPAAVPLEIELQGGIAAGSAPVLQVLTAPDTGDFNTLDEPNKVAPVTRPLKAGKGRLSFTAAAASLNVIKMPYR